MKLYAQTVLTSAGLLTASLGTATHAAQVDITNSNGTTANQMLNSYGGLGSTGFDTASNNGVSLWLRIRDKTQPSGSLSGGGVYQIDPAVAAAGNMRIDFQFSPQDGDAVPTGLSPSANNYYLMLQVDNDPTAGVNYASAPKYIVFDDDDNNGLFVKSPNGDIDDRDDNPGNGTTDSPFEVGDDQGELFLDFSWDDGDSLVIDGVAERNGLVSFNGTRATQPAYVVVNSWKPEWIPGGGYTTPSDPGLYSVKMTVFDATGNNELAALETAFQVVPEPGSLALLGLGGLALLRRRRA